MPGVVHGMRSLFLQDEFGQVLEATSISAGLDYPGVGPEHAMLAATGRAEYHAATDDEALAGFQLLSATEGIVPALEPAHAIGWVAREAGHAIPTGSTVLVTLSGRGDKDAAQVAEMLGELDRESGRTRSAPARARATRARKLLVPYVTGGLGREWREVVRAVVDAGADAVEVGIPFSDPIMDGRTIQEASQRALDLGATPIGVIDAMADDRRARAARRDDLLQPRRAARARARARSTCATAASTGAIVPDLPLDELDGWGDAADAAGVETVLLAAPTTPDDRLAAICERSHGFVYGVSLLGVTGERDELAGRTPSEMGRRCKAVDRQAGAARRRHLHARAGRAGRGERRRRDRRQRARAPAARRRRPRGGRGLRRLPPRRPRRLSTAGSQTVARSRPRRFAGGAHGV